MAEATSNAADLVGITDIARMIGPKADGVSKQRALQLMDRRLHPAAPAARQMARGRVWTRAAVVKYITGPADAGGLGRELAGGQ